MSADTEAEKIRRAIDRNKLFDCTNITRFISSIRSVLPFKGYSDSRFVICGADGFEFLTKVCFYRKSPSALYGTSSAGIMHQNDAEIKILEELNANILNKKVSPCIIEVYYIKKCEDLLDVAPPEKRCNKLVSREYGYDDIDATIESMFCRQKDFINANLSESPYCFIVMEQADITFDKYLMNRLVSPAGMAIVKSILFQIIYTIYAIKLTYPSFRHNDLHTDNVLIKFEDDFVLNPSRQQYVIFKTKDMEFAMPYFGATAKIIDFGFSIITEIGVVSDVVDNKKIMFMRTENDMIMLLHEIYHSSGRSIVIEEMLSKIDPHELYKTFNAEFIRRNLDKVPSYDNMLNCDLFEEYKGYKPMKGQIKEVYEIVV